jgi:hypothetical protein
MKEAENSKTAETQALNIPVVELNSLLHQINTNN